MSCDSLEIGDTVLTLGPAVLFLLLIGALASTHEGDADARIGA